jgi:HD domain
MAVPAVEDPTTPEARRGEDLVAWAATESAARLSGLGDRWLHVQGVAAKANWVSRAFEGEDQAYLLAAARLHDLGYAPSLKVSGLHQLDGAVHLRALGHERLARLVAHHSEARFELELRGRAAELSRFPRESSPVAAALIYCDLTTGPQGTPMPFDDRLAEVFSRYSEGSLVSEALRRARPQIAAAVEATEDLLRKRGVVGALPR